MTRPPAPIAMPDAGAHLDLLAVDLGGFGDDVDEAAGELEHLLGARGVFTQDDELVAAEARDQVAGADGLAQAGGETHEEYVAGGVAHRCR